MSNIIFDLYNSLQNEGIHNDMINLKPAPINFGIEPVKKRDLPAKKTDEPVHQPTPSQPKQSQTPPAPLPDNSIVHQKIELMKYGTRTWQVKADGQLVAVFVYKKGAQNVARILKQQRDEIARLHEELLTCLVQNQN